jgi:hypothetical protein
VPFWTAPLNTVSMKQLVLAATPVGAVPVKASRDNPT